MTFPVARRAPAIAPLPVVVLTVLLAVVASLLVGTTSGRADASSTGADASAPTHAKAKPKKDPRKTRGLFVDPRMKAAQAGPAFKTIGSKAQPLWITDYYAKSKVKTVVKTYVDRALKAKKTPLMTVYNIPDRDCGMYSSQDDQITDSYYRAWVTQVAAGMKGGNAIVVLEPDAIPFIGNPSCTGRGDRLGLIKYATKKLAAAGAWVYIDAGHSGWQTPEHMAPLLKQAGAAYARGIATNVANSRTSADEQAYATNVIKQLAKLKVTGRKYVMDTSRNGSGSEARPANGDVCNPLTAQLGAAPKLRFQGAFDGTLWVKLPGESDGPCNGGPSSGLFFPTGACRLMGTSSSYYDESTKTCR